MKKQIKELIQLVARAGNEIYRRKHWRKARHKEILKMEEVKRKANSNHKNLKDLMLAKEIWPDKLRKKIVKMERYKERGKALKNNSTFQMRETSASKQMRDHITMGKYQQWINSLNFGQAHKKTRVKHFTVNG